MTDEASDPSPQAVSWPAIILKGMAFAVVYRVFEHLTGLRTFRSTDLLGLAAVVAIAVCMIALPTQSPEKPRPVPTRTRSRRDRRAWLFVSMFVCACLIGRAALHWAGVLDYQKSTGLVFVLAVLFAYPLWMTRIR